MPKIGNVEVGDDVVAALARSAAPAAPERPGLGAVLGAAAQGAIGQVRYGLPYQAQKLTGTLTAPDEAFYQQGLRSSAAAAAQAAPANVDDLTSGRVGISRFVGENLAASLPYMVGGVVGGVGGALVGGAPGAVAGAIAGGVPQFSAANVDRAVQETGSLSQDAAERALAVAVPQAASDILVDRYLPGIGGLIGGLAAKQTGGFLARTAKSVLKAGGVEAVTEAGQQVGERYAAGLDVSSADAAGEYVNAAVTAFAVGGVLGAGGGFRRTAVNVKPAADVTTDDIMAHVDAALAGSAARGNELQLTPQDQEGFQPSLDLTGGTATEQQPALPFQDQPVVETPASALPQLGLDPALSTVPPETQLELGQRFTDNLSPVDLPAIGTQVSPEAEAALRGAVPAGVPFAGAQPRLDLTGASPTAIAAAQQGMVPGGDLATPVAAPALRLFNDDPLAELQAASKAKDASPEVKAAADEEIATRYQEAAGDIAPTGDFQQRLTELKDGIRGSFTQKLTATSPQELVTKVYDEVFVNQNTASNVTKLAQRLGLLDDALEPTAKSNTIEQERLTALQAEAAAPSAPVAPAPVPVATSTTEAVAPDVVETAPAANDPAFAQQWEELKKAAGITRNRSGAALAFTPANLQQAQATVFRAIATDTSNAAVSQNEKLARTMGLVTDNDAMDITPLGRATFLRTPEGAADVQQAAVEQGYAAAGTAAFQAGVNEQIGGPAATYTSFEDLAAHAAGKAWARNVVENETTANGAGAQAAQARIDARRTGVAVDRASVARTELSPGQIQQQGLNSLLDTVDLSNVKDTDVSMLRRMIRDGAPAAEVGQALADAQGGKTLFRQTPSPERVLSPLPVRGQPIFREMNTPERGPTKTESRRRNAEAVRAYELRNLIDQTLEDGGITAARAAKFHEMLDAGEVSRVALLMSKFGGIAHAAYDTSVLERLLKMDLPTTRDGFAAGRGMDDRRAAQYRKDFWRGKQSQEVTEAQALGVFGHADPALEAGLDGKSFAEAGDFVAANAPSPATREVMTRVMALAKQIEANGHRFEFKVVRPGDSVPIRLNNPGVKALTVFRYDPNTTTVYVKGTAMGESQGVNYQLVAHEMLHAVTMRVMNEGQFVRSADTKLGQARKDMTDLRNAIVQHFNARAAAGNLSAFEQQYYERQTNSLANVDEVLAWGLTNPEMQRYLQTIAYKPKQSVFSRFVEVMRNLLGLDPKQDTALTELLRVSEQVLALDARELAPAYARNDPDADATATLEAPAASGSGARSVMDANTATIAAADLAERAATGINLADKAVGVRRVLLGWRSRNDLDRAFGNILPAMVDNSNAQRQQDAVRGRMATMGAQAVQNFEQLERANPKAANMVNQLMLSTTQFQLDPDKAFDDHEHLKDDPNLPALKRLHGELVKMKNDLSRGDGAGIKMFNEFRRRNETLNYARMATELHHIVAVDREFALGVEGASVNPADVFMTLPNLSTAEETHAYWQGAVQDQLKAITAFVNQKKGEAEVGTPSEQRGLLQHIAPIEAKIAATYESLKGMARAPYFHLGRFGDNYGAATIRKLDDGTVDPVAQRHVAEALEAAGFRNAEISADNRRPKLSIRFETVQQTRAFEQLMLGLKQQGWLDADSKIEAGPRERADNFGTGDSMPSYVRSYIQAIENDPRYVPEPEMTQAEKSALAAQRDTAVQIARDTWIASMPDSSVSKVLTARYTIPGFDPDMTRNFAHRWNVGSNAIAGMSQAAKLTNSHMEMRAQVAEARVAGNDQDAYLAADLLTEIKKREARNPLNENATGFDRLRAFGHAYFLGFSPAYGMIQLMQVGTNGIPELAKKNGYAKSFHAVRRATPKAFAILKAAASEARAQGWKHAADITLTENVLTKAGLSPRETGFLRHMIATGSLDIGASAFALEAVARNNGGGGKLRKGTDVALKYASAIGMYTETASRLITSLAAADLHGGENVQESAKYAQNVVSNSMFDYQSWNTARQMGKQGFAGPVTPLLTQFMTYSAQMTEKLFSEVGNAIAAPRAGESTESATQRRQESRTYLLGHLTAITGLAGTLGLPFASVFATAIGKLVDTADNDDDPYDATASWRGFLADVLGKDVAEVVARGLPRAAGFDISSRVGEADLLPFSQLLGDKRSWREAVQATLGRSAGASPDMLLNLADGGEAFGRGDVVGGMKAFLPVAFKGPTEAYRMTTQGYVDTKGTKLPITPKASSILWQLLGFNPSEKAEYSEARGDQASRRVVITREANVLRSGIVKALRTGDTERARELVADAQKFDQDNPAFAVLPSVPGALKRQATTTATARATSTPLGVKAKDIAGRALTGYANFGY